MVERLSERTGYLPGGVNVGVVWIDDQRVLMVDTGLNESNGKKALKSIEGAGGTVVGVLTTHAHADHFGGNALIVKRTGALIYAPPIDEAILRHPTLMPQLLYAGADPPPSMRGRFLLADLSPVDMVLEHGEANVEDVHIEVIPLSGHSPGQVGYLIDGVFFCADIVLPPEALAKFKIPYLCSVTDHLLSLDRAATVRCDVAMPGHGPVVSSLAELIGLNRSLVDRLSQATLETLERPHTFDSLTAILLSVFDADPADAAAYYLIQPTIYAMLSYLEAQERIENVVANRQSTWVALG